MTISWVTDFADGDGTQQDLLGGKGAGLAEMTRMGLAVPPGFTVTTDACRHVMRHDAMPDDLWDQVDAAMARDHLALRAAVDAEFGPRFTAGLFHSVSAFRSVDQPTPITHGLRRRRIR